MQVPQSPGGSPVSMLLCVVDVDTQFARAVAAGTIEILAFADQFDGDRRGTLTDPFRHIWLLANRTDDISVDEIRRRFKTMMNQRKSSEVMPSRVGAAAEFRRCRAAMRLPGTQRAAAIGPDPGRCVVKIPPAVP
jgi:hypothetical protein